MIVSGGENITPVEVEQAIEGLKEIKEAAVIGIADEEWGQKVVAVVTLANGMHPDLDFLKLHLKGKIADFKLPKEVRIVDTLPKTTTGKVKRNELMKVIAKKN